MQTRREHLSHGRQLEVRIVRIIQCQVRTTRRCAHHRNIGHQNGDHDDRTGNGGCHRAQAVHTVDQRGETNCGHNEAHKNLQEHLAEVRSLTQRRHVAFQRLKVHDVDQCDVGNHRRDKGVFDDLDIRNADEFHHQERSRAHNRRHDLTVDRGCDLDRARLFSGKAHALHQRDRKGTRCHNVRDGRTGNQASHSRTNDRRFRRTATQRTQTGKGDLDEIVACARLIQKRAEQNEEENKSRRNTQRDAEDTRCIQPLRVDDRVERQTRVFDDIRDQPAGAHVRIGQKDRPDDRQSRTKRAARCF